MSNSSEIELRRQMEEPLSGDYRPYPLADDRVLMTMFDTPCYPPHVPDIPHCHNCLEIALCLSGCGEVSLLNRRWRFRAGSVLVAPRGVYHSQHNTGEPLTHWRYLVVNDECLQRRMPDRCREPIAALLDEIRNTGLFLESGVDGGMDAVGKLMYDLRRIDDASADAELELCVYLLLLEIARQKRSARMLPPGRPTDFHLRQPIEPALAYVCEHYKEDIRIGDLARSCSMSESYFRKQFHRIMGMSPMEHVNRYRIHRAMALLYNTGDAVQIIAGRVGFSSIAAFNRNFKCHAGMSPSRWRHSCLNK